MCKFIGVELLAANALIDLVQENKRTITFKELNDYGICVVNFLEQEFDDSAVILYNERNSMNRILNYTEYFDISDETISLKGGVKVEELIDKFRAPLAYEILKAVLYARRALKIKR